MRFEKSVGTNLTGKNCASAKLTRKLPALALAAAATLATTGSVHAQTQLSWDGDAQGAVNGGPGQWDLTLARWWDGITLNVWNSSTSTLDIANFTGAGGTVNLFGPTSGSPINIYLGGMNFNSNGYFIHGSSGAGGGFLNLNANGGVQANINVASGVVAGMDANMLGTTGYSKDGSGELQIFTSNTAMTGSINFNAGRVVNMTTGGSVGDNAALTVATGATWDLRYSSDVIGSLAGGGDVILGLLGDNFGAVSGSQLTVGTLNTSTVYSGNMSLNGVSAIPGVGGKLNKVGTGVLTLTGNNTYGGVTNIQTGTIQVSGGNAIPDTSPVFFGSATALSALDIGSSTETVGSLGGGTTNTAGAPPTGGQVFIGGGSLIIGGDNYTNTFMGALNGSGTIKKIGSGAQYIGQTAQTAAAMAVSTFTGKYIIESGTLAVSGDITAGRLLDTRLGPAPASFTADAITLAGGVYSNTSLGGYDLQANRGITVTANSGFNVIGSAASNLTVQGVITGSANLTKTGFGILGVNADNAASYSGDWIVTDGKLSTARNPAGGAAGNPFGTGGFNVTGSSVEFVPAAGTNNVTYSAASASGETFTYGPGANLIVNRNTNTDLVLTMGNAGASTNSVFVRGTRGSLVVQAASTIASLGTAGAEKIVVNGGVGTINNIIPGAFGTTSAGSTAGDFLSYGANGIVKATYTSADLTTSFPTDIVEVTAATGPLTTPAFAHALKLNANVDMGGQTVNIGNGTDPAQLIVNTTVTTTNGGAFNFGTSEAQIYAQGAAGVINATIQGSNGLTKVGFGQLILGATATYSGPTDITQGTIQLSGGDNRLPTNTDVNINGAGVLDVNGFTQQIGKLSGNQLGTIAFGLNGTLKVGDGDSTYLGGGTITTGSTTATLWKAGTGVLTLGNDKTSNLPGTGNGFVPRSISYNRLWVTNGGVVSINNTTTTTPNAPAAATADTYMLDNGTLRFTGFNAQSTSTVGVTQQSSNNSFGTNKGLLLNAGGGTIEVVNPLEIILANGTGNVISGGGNLTKAGPGTFRLGTANTYTGKTIVLGGILQITGDGSLGGVPGGVVNDSITISNGAVLDNSTNVTLLNANRGITIGTGGGELRNNAAFTIQGPIIGSAPIKKSGTSTLTVTANNSSTLSSPIEFTRGRIDVNANDALGTGVLTMNPLFALTLAHGTDFSDLTLANPIVLLPGNTIDLRSDNSVGALILNGQISGAGNLYRGLDDGQAQGTVVLNNSANSFTGNLTLMNGNLVVGNANVLGSAAGHTYVEQGAALVMQGGWNYTTAETTYIAGAGASSSPNGAINNVSGANVYAGNVILVADSAIQVAGGSSLQTGQVSGGSTLTVNGGGNLLAAGYRVNSMIVNNPKAEVTVGRSTAKTSRMTNLTLNGSSQLDLQDNDMVVNTGGTSLTTIVGLLTTGYNGGGWNGAGPSIISTAAANSPSSTKTALGVALASDSFLGGAGVFSGQTVAATDVLVRYTIAGDANLDGTSNSADFNILATNFGVTSPAMYWATGDFTYNGSVNSADFNVLASGFGQTVATGPGSAVPEPSALSLLAIGVAGLAARRRRRA